MDKIFANYIGNLSQGVGGSVKGTSTIYLIKYDDIPEHQKYTYGRIVVYSQPHK